MLRISLIALASLLWLGAPAHASQIRLDFTGTVTVTDGAAAGLGDTLSGWFAYNDDLSACGNSGGEDALTTFCNAGPGYTIGPDWSASITLGSQTVTLTSSQFPLELLVYLGRFVDPGDPSQGHGADSFHFYSQTGEFTIDLRNLGGTGLSDPDGTFPTLPTSLDLSAWPDQSTLRIAGLGLGSFTAQLNTLTVPEPATALLLSLGLFGIYSARKQR